jgi:hypothetical protein
VSDRLRELQRQRALVEEQRAWLDREIAKESQTAAGSQPPAAPVAPGPIVAVPTEAIADEILAQHHQSAQSAAKDVKRGCYLYFAFAMGAVVLFAVAVYLIYSRRP